ncbi:MAG: hypothetical protein COB37_01315 [Kordiimonadales bacterium]|nr:MAG: hypothetical protein COB37_01315 [Kordiimonadales bacterium]
MKLWVHPSVQHGKAILLSTEKRTGKTVDAWVALARDRGLKDKRDIINFLRTEHSLGGSTAMMIASKVQSLPEDFEEGAYLARAPELIDAQYVGKKAHLRPVADQIYAILDALGDDVGASPCKGYVPFYRQHVFAQVKAATQKRIDVGLALGRYSGAVPDFVKSTGGSEKGDRITHVIAVSSSDDIGDELTQWAKRAYELDN